jgi:hypothetical protein
MDAAWVWVAAALAVLALAGWVWPVSIDLSARAQGEPDGSWAAAFGLAVGPLGITGVMARGVPLTVALHLFGKQVVHRRPRKPTAVSSDVSAARGLRVLSGRLERALDPAGAFYSALRSPRGLRVRFVTVDLAYSFRDAALTGRLLGSIYALSALLPAKVEVRQNARWEFDDRWSADAESRLVTRPVAFVVHVLWILAQKKLWRGRRHRPRELTSPR